jgi:hypothetical protein
MRIATRALLIGSLIITVLSILLDIEGADPSGLACRAGLCREEQIIESIGSSEGGTHSTEIEGFRRLVEMSPADAYAWAGLAEYLVVTGSAGAGRKALERAVELAPGMPQIRMRRVNLCFEGGDKGCVLGDGRAVMAKTGNFDAILFSYYTALNIEVQDVLTIGLPDGARAVRAWAIHLAKDANSQVSTLRTWDWMRERGLVDEPTVCRLTNELVHGRQPDTAWRIWSEYRPGAYGQRDEANRLTNSRFERQPVPAPFDWELRPQAGVGFVLGSGLEVSFEGKSNTEMANVRQLVFVHPGPHRLIVDVAHEELTTDQGPYVRVSGEGPGAQWSVESEMFKGSAGRRKIAVDFVAPAGAALARVQLERKASEKFDNKIAGRLKLYEVSLFEQ